MYRKWFGTYLATAALSFMFGACGGDRPQSTEDECVNCPPGAGAAIWCYGLGGIKTGMCGATADLAAFQCIEGGGNWVLADICIEEVGSETWGNDEPWDPGRDVAIDPSSGDFIIDRLALDELKRNSSLLFSDSSTLEELEDGYFMLTASGPLSEALGWELGDVLLNANGYELENTAAFADAYPYLTESQRFELRIDRDGREVVLRYRVK